MNYEHYTDVIFSDDYHLFLFDSIGPKGVLKKAVIYSELDDFRDAYNLSLGTIRKNEFGDEYIDGREISNNGDRNKILATIALTAFAFLDKYPDKRIYLRGIDTPRTRLYQIAINQVYKEISDSILIWGDISENIGVYDLHPIKQGVNYTGFLIGKK